MNNNKNRTHGTRGTYTSFADNMPEAREKKTSVREKCADIEIVKLSLDTLWKLTFSSLTYLSYQDEKKAQFGPIVDWAHEILNNIVLNETNETNETDKTSETDKTNETNKRRQCVLSAQFNELKKLYEDTAYDHPRSSLYSYLRISKREDQDGNFYPHIGKLYSINFVNNKVLEENTMTVREAQVDTFLDQICYRLNLVISYLEINKNSQHDIYALGVLIRIRNDIYDLAQETIELVKKMNELRETQRNHYKKHEFETVAEPREAARRTNGSGRSIPEKDPIPYKNNKKNKKKTQVKPKPAVCAPYDKNIVAKIDEFSYATITKKYLPEQIEQSEQNQKQIEIFEIGDENGEEIEEAIETVEATVQVVTPMAQSIQSNQSNQSNQSIQEIVGMNTVPQNRRARRRKFNASKKANNSGQNQIKSDFVAKQSHTDEMTEKMTEKMTDEMTEKMTEKMIDLTAEEVNIVEPIVEKTKSKTDTMSDNLDDELIQVPYLMIVAGKPVMTMTMMTRKTQKLCLSLENSN